MSANVPLKVAFDELAASVALLSETVGSLPKPVEFTVEEKAAIKAVMALINRLIGET